MLHKSSVYNTLAETMHFWDKSKLIEFHLFELSTACLKLPKLLLWFLKPEVSICYEFYTIL